MVFLNTFISYGCDHKNEEERVAMRYTSTRLVGAIGAIAGLIGGGILAEASAQNALPVADGTKVTLEYTLSLPDKTVVESNVGQEPISYQHGKREIIPGLEKAMAGMKAGEKKHVTVTAENGPGQHDKQKKVPVSK